MGFAIQFARQPDERTEMLVRDCLEDPDLRLHPSVVGHPWLRSLAGFPLISPGGRVLGALCALSFAPGSLDDESRRALEDLARDGADCVITYRRNEAAAVETVGALQALGRRARAERLDLGEPEQVGPVFERVRAAFDRVDVLVAKIGRAHV